MIYEPLTREMLLEQGKCCGSGCMNCPYLPKHEEGSKVIGDVE